MKQIIFDSNCLPYSYIPVRFEHRLFADIEMQGIYMPVEAAD